MANSLTAFNPELWRAEMQETFFKESTALGVASVDLRAELSVGDTLHQPYGGYARVQTYTKGTDITVKDVNATDDFLTVDTAKVASFYVDKLIKIVHFKFLKLLENLVKYTSYNGMPQMA